MAERRRQIRGNLIAFALLFTVSLYRQISLHLWPDDPFRTWILYTGYVVLIGSWAVSIKSRITAGSMRVFLLADAAVMMYGLTIRFVQDTWWQDNTALMRISGLFVETTILPMLAMGFFASLGTGRADTYRINPKWYLVLIPTAVMTILTMLDEQLHFMFYIIPEEPQPNLMFHPSTGTFLVLGMAIAIMIVRILIIFQRNRSFTRSRIQRVLIAMFEPILAILFSFPFFAVSMQLIPALGGVEIIELYAKIYYVEVLTWEFYIWIGLVPVNVEYRGIFEHADIGMQLIGTDGSRIRSESAAEVTPDQLRELESRESITTSHGFELHAYRLKDGLFLWNKDVSQMQDTINQLRESAEALEQEGGLLEEEWKTREQETRLAARNQIYDELIREVEHPLQMIRETAEHADEAVGEQEMLRRLVLLGTYIKRRCNLRLIQKNTPRGTICADDLRISIRDLTDAMSATGIRTRLDWMTENAYSPEFAIHIFDTMEALLEQNGFSPQEVILRAEDKKALISVFGKAGSLPMAGMAADEWKERENGIDVILTDGGNADAE